MSKYALTKTSEKFPALFDDFFKPWNEWFDNDSNFWNRTFRMPAVNITEDKDEYNVSLAVPGMKKDDFKIDVDGNMLTISCEKDETKEEKDKKYTRKEYSYSSFSRSFTLPDEVNSEKIDARYENGLLRISLPRKEEVKKSAAKQIAVK
ncbi:MAG TPA: Hsp20/alpha crystallin family protein [Chitinophagaceae bacterium]|jgi:HSP20 family protein|nr:Hsp20/alpha crystallin family protein [Chitinophagaceae bacterium]